MRTVPLSQGPSWEPLLHPLLWPLWTFWACCLVMAGLGSCGTTQDCAFAEVICGCVKATCNVLGRFGFFSAPCPRGYGRGLGPTSPHPGKQQVPGSGCRTTHHCKVCILPGLSRGLLLSRGGGTAVCRSNPASKGESDHQAAQSCQCPFNYKVMDSPALRLSSAPALAGTVMIVRVELMRRAHL